MFANLFKQKFRAQHSAQKGANVTGIDMQISVHYGIPYTASILAFDHVQRLMAIGTLDGRIKIIGGNNIECILISPKTVPYKYLQFLQNEGFLVAISNDNDIQVWSLEFRKVFYSLHWDFNITAFAVLPGTRLMFLGDVNGLLSVLKYNIDDSKLQKMPYTIPLQILSDSAAISPLDEQPIVGILPQTHSSGIRLLIAYEKGLLVLWDVYHNQVLSLRGNGDVQLKSQPATDSTGTEEYLHNSVAENEENEICSLCWASKTGSVVAVGYLSGDILLWDMSPQPSRKGKDTSLDVVKLQLASGDRRLPVIILHWTAASTNNDKNGHLFIYGGDDMGSEEVLTVLTLEFSSGLETMRCASRMNINLNGSFADMILVSDAGSPEKAHAAAFFVLTNPGQLTMYDMNYLNLQKHEDSDPRAEGEKFPVSVPTTDPYITVTKLCQISSGKEFTNVVLKKSCAQKPSTPSLSGGTKWPVSGGVPGKVVSESDAIDQIFIAGYQNGSVRIWDASLPVLALMFVLDATVPHIASEIHGNNASVTSLAFCTVTMMLAVGDESGLIRVYKYHDGIGGSSFHFVSEAKQEVHIIHHGKGFHCNIAFMGSRSPIRALEYILSGERLAAGYENGQVAMLDLIQLSVVFCTDCPSETGSPVVSLKTLATYAISSTIDSPEISIPEKTENTPEMLICLTKDAHITILDGTTGISVKSRSVCKKQHSSAICLYVIDEEYEQLMQDQTAQVHEPGNAAKHGRSEMQSVNEQQQCSYVQKSSDITLESFILVCCEGAFYFFSPSFVMLDASDQIHEVKLSETCCWTMPFRKMGSKAYDILLVNQNGSVEIRSFPDFEVTSKSSLMSILRWSYKINLDKSMSSSNGQVALVNGSEFVILSLSCCENGFRTPESFPCLHDEALAIAAQAALNVSNQNKRQDPVSGILGGIMKGLKGGKNEENKERMTVSRNPTIVEVEELFSRAPFSESLITDDIVPEEEELSIDDIVIDDVVPTPSVTTIHTKKKTTDEEREKLFAGSSNPAKPRARTTQEILTQYKFGGDASAAASYAKEKLMQRQEKLERLSERTAELQSGAENFADLANELAKRMENKKWWKL